MSTELPFSASIGLGGSVDLWGKEEGEKGGVMKRVWERAHGEEGVSLARQESKRRKKAGGKWSKVRRSKEKKALTLKEKRDKRITGQSLGRARHVYKVVNGDWPLVPAMYLSDVSSPSRLRPVLLVADPLNRYFESPHGGGMQEIMPDRVRNAELRRLLGLSAEDEPRCEDSRKEHLELVRMCEARWRKCPMMYEGVRPEKFNVSNNRRDLIIKEVLLDPINEICRSVGLEEVRAYWTFHASSEARGVGYYSERWSANRSLQYTDDKLFMKAYVMFAEKYEKSAEGPRPSEKNPPGRHVEMSWVDDSNVATEERIEEKQLAKWQEAVKKRKGVVMRKGDCATIRRKLIKDMQEAGGKWAFDIDPVRPIIFEPRKPAKGEVKIMRMSVVYYWPEDRVDIGSTEIDIWTQQDTMAMKDKQAWISNPQQMTENLAIINFAHRTNLTKTFPKRYTPLGIDVWKPHYLRLPEQHKKMYAISSVTHLGSLPILAEALHKYLIPRIQHNTHLLEAYILAWETLDIRLHHEHTWNHTWAKIVTHIEHYHKHLTLLAGVGED